MRCHRHDLAAGPDGACAICRREELREQSRGATTRVFVWSGIFIGAAFAIVLTIGLANRVSEMQREAHARARANASAEALAGPSSTLAPEHAQTPAQSQAQPTAGAPTWGQAQPGAVRVIVYTTSWCPHCRKAKAWLAARSQPYEEHDVEAEPSYAREMRKVNPRGGVPTIDVEGDILVGFSEEALARAIATAAARNKTR